MSEGRNGSGIESGSKGQKQQHASSRSLAYRSTQLVRLGALLRSLAREHDCAIVVANQVSDRFPSSPPPPPPLQSSHPPSSSSSLSLHSVLSLDHQQGFFTGWGAHPPFPSSSSLSSSFTTTTLKTPSLGPVWTNQIACRIALTKCIDLDPNTMTTTRTRRWMKVVFAPWVRATGEEDTGVEFEIGKGGIRACASSSSSFQPPSAE